MGMARRSELGRALQTYAAGKATGERALVAAVIGYAARDALDGDAAAAAWFLSDGYHWYLGLLGLPADWLPKGLDRATLAGMVEAVAGRRARATSSGSATPSGRRRGARPGRRAATWPTRCR